MLSEQTSAVLSQLRQRIRRLERLEPASAAAVLCFGLSPLDGALPWGGLPCGALHEIAGQPGDAAAFGFVVALLGRLNGLVLWCRQRRDGQETGQPYGPGLARFGLAPERLLLVQAAHPAELLWAMEEGLRSGRLAAVVGEGVLPDLTASRRLQLAAETGDALALLLPPPAAEPPPSVALTRWRVVAQASRPDADGVGRPAWRASLWRCRGGRPYDWNLEWDVEALRFHLAAVLADRPLAAAAAG